jgi:signal peptidase I
MAIITSLILALFVTYGLAWYTGFLQGNFAVVLFMAVLVSGLYWVAEKLYFLPNRKKKAQAIGLVQRQRMEKLQDQGIKSDVDAQTLSQEEALALRQPWWLDWTAGIFPVLFFVFVIRSFAFEPFKIPSGSMIPTLHIGDLILVNKFTYGLRLPIIHTKLTEGQSPQRGDIMVFRYPPEPNLDYIKRVVAIPGDEVRYINKTLTVNGVLYPKTTLPEFLDESTNRYSQHFIEDGSGNKAPKYEILNEQNQPNWMSEIQDFPFKENCSYTADGVSCTVPPGHYFMMGDNRDNSQDSRYWGFVPEANIVGKAVYIWMNFGKFDRIGAIK